MIKSSFGSKRQCMLPFWCDYVAKRQCRLPFPRKIIFFQLQIKIISDIKKSSFGLKRQCMLPFWCDYVAKRQCGLPFPGKSYFSIENIKKNCTSTNRVSVQKGKWPSSPGQRMRYAFLLLWRHFPHP